MFVSESRVLPLGVSAARSSLLGCLDGAELAELACASQQSVEVQVQCLDPFPRDGETVLPIRWLVSDPVGVYPSLDADISLAALAGNAGSTRLTLTGSYRHRAMDFTTQEPDSPVTGFVTLLAELIVARAR